MKKDIENFIWLFQIEEDEGIGGKCTCEQRIAIKERIIKLLRLCAFPLSFRKGKTDNFSYQFRAIKIS